MEERTLDTIRSKEVIPPMCFEYESDLRLTGEDEQAQEEIRRLFERYRASRRRESEIMTELELEAAEREPMLAAH